MLDSQKLPGHFRLLFKDFGHLCQAWSDWLYPKEPPHGVAMPRLQGAAVGGPGTSGAYPCTDACRATRLRCRCSRTGSRLACHQYRCRTQTSRCCCRCGAPAGVNSGASPATRPSGSLSPGCATRRSPTPAPTHWLRHTYAKGLPQAEQDGLDASAALEIMGHSDLRTFCQYFDDEPLKRALATHLARARAAR